MNETFQQRLAKQLEVTFRSGSTYVVLGIGVLASLYAGMSDVQQAAFLANFPFLKGYGGILSAVAAFLVSRIKPSTAVSSQTQALIAEVTRLRMNMLLKAAGQPEIPAPPSVASLPVSVPAPTAAQAPAGATISPAPIPAQPPPAPPPPAPVPPPPPPPAPVVDPMLEQLRAMAKPSATDEEIVAAFKALRALSIRVTPADGVDVNVSTA